jgi:hypothetical protein
MASLTLEGPIEYTGKYVTLSAEPRFRVSFLYKQYFIKFNTIAPKASRVIKGAFAYLTSVKAHASIT